ncbi:phospholipase D family protein [Thiotrichales bacterium 19S9-12]|nr:phospholipase D family protein [Thiotrichales bacterium 19S9-11]MCF6812359.1 phospholipase D family protein [Thiotrichales bacterium 19S9-12]
MNFKKTILISISSLLIASASFAAETSGTFDNTPYEVCFTPSNGQCTKLIVNEINQAKNSINIQAYSFTSKPIVEAIVKAYDRGVNVTPILDKIDATDKYSVSHALTDANIPVWIDYHPKIAHNKVMIIDNQTVITGSFNWTKSADYQNAENILIIKNKELASKYNQNFNTRKKAAVILPKYCELSGKCTTWWDKVKDTSSSIYDNISQAAQDGSESVKNWFNN